MSFPRLHVVLLITVQLLLTAACAVEDYEFISASVYDRDVVATELAFPISITKFGNGYAIVTDRKPSLFVYSSAFQLKQRIERVGQGPGEFIDPRFIATVGQDSLAVFDWSNQKIVVLDSKLSFVRQWPVQPGRKREAIILTSSQGRIVSAPSHNPDSLLTIYARDGRKIADYGSKPSVMRKDYPIPIYSLVGEFISNESIIVLFRYMPIMRKYNSAGGLIWQKPITMTSVSKVIDKYGNPEENDSLLLPGHLITSSCRYREGIVISSPVNWGYCSIGYIDTDGNLLQEYLIKLPEVLDRSYTITDMCIDLENRHIIGIMDVGSAIVRIPIPNSLGSKRIIRAELPPIYNIF